MNKILKIVIKECLLYWLVASAIMLTISIYIDNYLWKILSVISMVISKIIYEDYISKFYTNLYY